MRAFRPSPLPPGWRRHRSRPAPYDDQASGAIAGVMGSNLLMFPRARVDVIAIFGLFLTVFTLPAWLVPGLWFGIQLLGGLLISGGRGGFPAAPMASRHIPKCVMPRHASRA